MVGCTGKMGVHVSVLELLSRAVPHLCLLPAEQHDCTCLPWAPCVSVTSFQSQPVPVDPQLDVPLLPLPPVVPLDVLLDLFITGSAGAGKKRSTLPLGEKPLLEIWAGSSPANRSGRSPTGMGRTRLWQDVWCQGYYVVLWRTKPGLKGSSGRARGVS